MDINDAAVDYVEAAGFKFGKVTVRDRSRILRQLKKSAREAMIENFKVSGIDDPGAKYAELENFDRQPLVSADFIAHLNCADGQEEILLLGLQKMYKGDGEAEAILDRLSLTPQQTLTLVAKMAGLEVEAKTAPAEGTGSANPPETPAAEPKPAALQGYGAA